MNAHTLKFHRLAKKLVYKIKNVSALVNDVVTRRKDIQSVTFHGHFVMTIPRKMYGRPIASYKDLLGHEQKHVYDREYHAKNWSLIFRRTDHVLKLEAEKTIDAKLWNQAL